jgi:tetratricopeptide (TPR) repeat protein
MNLRTISIISCPLAFTCLLPVLTALTALPVLIVQSGPADASTLSRDEVTMQTRKKSGQWMATEEKARNFVKQKQYDRALELFNQVLQERRGLDLDLQTERLAIAEIYEKTNKFDMANTSYKDAIREREILSGDENPVLSYTLESYAAFLKRNKKMAEAAAVQKRIAYIAAQTNKAPRELTALLQNAPARSSSAYKEWAKKTAAAACEIGQRYLLRDQEKRALIAFNKAIELDPGNSDAYEGRGEVYNRADDSRSAKDFDRAIALNGSNAQALFHRALQLRTSKNEKAALADFNKAVAAAPKDCDILGYRAKLHQDQKQYKEAVADYSHVLEMAPHAEWARCQRGLCYLDMKDFDKALIDFNQLATSYPDDSNYQELKARALRQKK